MTVKDVYNALDTAAPFAGACECDDVVLREIRLRGALHFASGKKESHAGGVPA